MLYITQWGGVEFTMNIAPVHISTCHPEVEELPGGALHAVKNHLRINKLSAMLSVQKLVEYWLLDIVLRYELNEHSRK